MDECDSDLKNHIIFVADAINLYERKKCHHDHISLDNTTRSFLNSLIRTCSDCDRHRDEIKRDIIGFLLTKHLGLDTNQSCVPCHALSLELIVSAAVDNQIYGFSHVLDSCFHQSQDSVLVVKNSFFIRFKQILNERLEKKNELDKTILFVIDMFVESTFGREMIDSYISECDFR